MFPELADSQIVITNAKVAGVSAWEGPCSFEMRRLMTMGLWLWYLSCMQLGRGLFLFRHTHGEFQTGMIMTKPVQGDNGGLKGSGFCQWH